MRHAIVTALVLSALVFACKQKETRTASDTAGAGDGVHGYSTAAPATQTQPPATPATATGTEVGSVMPAYSAQWLDGRPFDLGAERGKIVLLNLWATWCLPCRTEIPELQAMHDQHKAEGFEVIGVSLDDADAAQAVRDFVAEKKMTYPIALDPDGKLANIFQTPVLPTTVLIDRDGTIVWKKYGMVEAKEEALAKALEAALATPKR